jgi:hypothetical protein
MIEKKYFCYEIYKNLAVWSTADGQVGYNPCSYFNGFIETSDSIDIGKVWNGPGHLKLKHQVENDQPVQGCERCYKDEDNGLSSRRQGSKQLYEDFHQDTKIDLLGPQGIDYSVGNLCNLKCIICGPSNSTSWIPDYQQLNPARPVHMFKHKKNKQILINDNSYLSEIKNIHFHGGGEPLLADSHVKLLQLIKQTKGLGDVRVFYNTNGTTNVDQQVLDLWSECNLIEIYFSIDDIGQRFNYQRTNANWQELNDNLEWFYQNMPHNHMFKINCTWSYLNFYYLNELIDWHQQKFATNRYGDTTELIFQKAIGAYAINSISSAAFKKLQQKFNLYPSLLALLKSLKIDDEYCHNNFWNKINKLDLVRNSNFKLLCPEWAELL